MSHMGSQSAIISNPSWALLLFFHCHATCFLKTTWRQMLISTLETLIPKPRVLSFHHVSFQSSGCQNRSVRCNGINIFLLERRLFSNLVLIHFWFLTSYSEYLLLISPDFLVIKCQIKCRTRTLISSLAAIIYWMISVHFPALANASQWYIFPAVILLWSSDSLLSRLIHQSLFSLSIYLFNDCFKANMSKTELLIFAPVFNTWITGNTVVLTSRAKIVGVTPYASSHIQSVWKFSWL